MKTIVINSQKGGSGKTMFCAHLSTQAERAGDGPVYLIDTDPQGTLSKWHQRREAEVPHRVELPFVDIPRGLQQLSKEGVAYCFIDTPPTITDETAVLLNLADLVIVPVQPSPSDLWSAANTVELLKGAGKPFVFVINRTKPNASITAQAVAVLSEYGRVTPTLFADRVHYAAAMTDGRTALELAPKGPAAKETAELWQNIKTCLHVNNKTSKKEAVSHART